MKYGEPEAKDWDDEIQKGLDYRLEYAHEHKFNTVEQMFYLGHRSNASVGPNLIYSTGDLLMSTLSLANPTALAIPRRLQDVLNAPLVQAVDNELIHDMDMPDAMETATLYAYFWGTSFLKIGYDSEWGFAPQFDFDGGQAGLTMTRVGKFGKDKFLPIEFNANITPGMPWVQPVSAHDIVVPWGTRTLRSCPWIAHRCIRHIEYLRKDVKYDKRATNDIEPFLSMEDFVSSYSSTIKPYRMGQDFVTPSTNAHEYVEFWEIHDLRFKKVYCVVPGYHKYLRNDIDHLQDYGLPFVELSFIPRGLRIWRPSDAMYVMYHQAELADIAIQSQKQRRLNIVKFLVRKGLITKGEMAKMLSADVGAAIEVDDIGTPFNEIITNMPLSGANQLLLQDAEYIRSNARETVGLDRNSFGEYRGARTTATEVDAVQEAKGVRLSRRQNIVRRAYIDVLCKMNKIVERYWKSPRVTSIVGMDGLPQWQTYVGDQLRGKYTIDITVDDAPVPTQESQRGEAAQMYQLGAQDPLADQVEARRQLATQYGPAAMRLYGPAIRQLGQSRVQPSQAGPPRQGAPGQRRKAPKTRTNSNSR